MAYRQWGAESFKAIGRPLICVELRKNLLLPRKGSTGMIEIAGMPFGGEEEMVDLRGVRRVVR